MGKSRASKPGRMVLRSPTKIKSILLGSNCLVAAALMIGSKAPIVVLADLFTIARAAVDLFSMVEGVAVDLSAPSLETP